MDPRQNNTVLYSTSASLYTGMAIAGSNLLLTSPTQLLPCKLVRFRPHSEPFSCESVIPLSDPMAIKYATILKNGTIILAADRLYSIDPRDQTPRAILGAVRTTVFCFLAASLTVFLPSNPLSPFIYSTPILLSPTTLTATRLPLERIACFGSTPNSTKPPRPSGATSELMVSSILPSHVSLIRSLEPSTLVTLWP